MTNPVGIVTDRAPFARLAALPPADYGRVREAEAWDRYLAHPGSEAVEQWDLAAAAACSGTQPSCSG